MPVPKKKRITAENALSTSQASSLPLPEQQEFHQHLRALAQSAVRTVLELVMREELDAFIGVAWGSVVPNAKAIATAPIRAIWPRRLVGSKISRYPEIVKATSIPRRLNATVAMNRTSPKA
jgi:hypothetical protein